MLFEINDLYCRLGIAHNLFHRICAKGRGGALRLSTLAAGTATRYIARLRYLKE
ncbi:hypothetical protein [Pseudoduganella umbonata]|uniref:hypothetical protein n=1 Tax=Pseudoduganella umbonata TaxID=864828 RepID=UPI001C87867C|nr:hypothetical protein [Pseudoduganella umbonata]